MATTLQKRTPAGQAWEPKLNVAPDRRHSSATPLGPSTENSRRGSAASGGSRKSSDGQPSWMSAMKDRDRNGSVDSANTAPEHRRSSLGGLFGRKKSHDEGKPKQKTVLISKHAGSVKNTLKADPRGARKHPSNPAKAAALEGTQNNAHLTAAEQEARHPHSGPPALHGGLPMLTRIVSIDEEDSEDRQSMASSRRNVKTEPELDKVREHEVEPEETSPQGRRHSTNGHAGPVSGENTDGTISRPRRKSLLDVEVKAADRPRPSSKKMVFGGWHRDEKGNWTRK